MPDAEWLNTKVHTSTARDLTDHFFTDYMEVPTTLLMAGFYWEKQDSISALVPKAWCRWPGGP
jgi:hypothetical protein